MSDEITTGYNITTDSNFLDKQNAITPELSRKLERFHKLALEGKKSSVQKILDAIEQYPDNPQLKNYLSVLYGHIGDTKRLYETNHWILAEHPNYLFGKLNLANVYYLNKEYHKMPEVLGEAMELKALYPNRDTFHLNEVISFFKCAILYFTAIGDIDQAEVRYEIMQELAPEASDTEVALNQLYAARMEVNMKRFEEEEKNRISVETKMQEINDISKAPKFKHEETEWLYCNGLYISEDKLNTILSLPKETLIADLELVLQDSIDRYGYFSDLVEKEDWDEERMNFVVHAIYLLGELESAQSLKNFLKVLSQSDEYFDLYLGDFLSSMIWEPLYKLASNNLEACKQFMFEPGINTFAKTNFPNMVEQLALHQPDRRNEVIQWFKNVIDFFLTSKLEDNVIDSDLIGFLICNIIDIEGVELLPEIEALFEKRIVSQGICGDWEEVKEAFEQPDTYDKKKEIVSITECYKQITATWAGYNEEENSSPFDYDDYFEPSIMPISTEPKIGRNDPCPCGSGKKYKKCCLNK